MLQQHAPGAKLTRVYHDFTQKICCAREQNQGAKVLLRNIFFSREIVGTHEGALGAISLVCTGLNTYLDVEG